MSAPNTVVATESAIYVEPTTEVTGEDEIVVSEEMIKVVVPHALDNMLSAVSAICHNSLSSVDKVVASDAANTLIDLQNDVVTDKLVVCKKKKKLIDGKENIFFENINYEGVTKLNQKKLCRSFRCKMGKKNDISSSEWEDKIWRDKTLKENWTRCNGKLCIYYKLNGEIDYWNICGHDCYNNCSNDPIDTRLLIQWFAPGSRWCFNRVQRDRLIHALDGMHWTPVNRNVYKIFGLSDEHPQHDTIFAMKEMVNMMLRPYKDLMRDTYSGWKYYTVDVIVSYPLDDANNLVQVNDLVSFYDDKVNLKEANLRPITLEVALTSFEFIFGEKVRNNGDVVPRTKIVHSGEGIHYTNNCLHWDGCNYTKKRCTN